MTKRDLLEGNGDLISAAIAVLRKQPAGSLTATVRSRSTNAVELAVTATGIDRVDVWHKSRPLMSVDMGAKGTLSLPVKSGEVTLQGFKGGQLRVVGHVKL
jgi:hypothetical protein